MQWEFEQRDGVGVLWLSGFLSDRSTHRFQGAFDWACARCTGTIVIDMSALRGWSKDGEAAIVDVAGRLPAARGPLVICGLQGRATDLLRTGAALSLLRIHQDLDAALAAARGA